MLQALSQNPNLPLTLTQGENVNPCPQKKTKKKKKGNKKSERKQKEEIPNRRVGESEKRKKIADQRSEENRKNMQKGLWTRQYLNNTKLSPKKKRKETTT